MLVQVRAFGVYISGRGGIRRLQLDATAGTRCELFSTLSGGTQMILVPPAVRSDARYMIVATSSALFVVSKGGVAIKLDGFSKHTGPHSMALDLQGRIMGTNDFRYGEPLKSLQWLSETKTTHDEINESLFSEEMCCVAFDSHDTLLVAYENYVYSIPSAMLRDKSKPASTPLVCLEYDRSLNLYETVMDPATDILYCLANERHHTGVVVSTDLKNDARQYFAVPGICAENDARMALESPAQDLSAIAPLDTWPPGLVPIVLGYVPYAPATAILIVCENQFILRLALPSVQ